MLGWFYRSQLLCLVTAVLMLSGSVAYCSEHRFPDHWTCDDISKELTQCDFFAESEFLSNRILLKLYGPRGQSWQGLPIVVYLHGRGASSGEGRSGQFLTMGFKEHSAQKQYQEDPFVVVAPQDHFVHRQGRRARRGQDYWLGTLASKRDWERFLGEELVPLLDLKYDLGKSHCERLIAGVSMGAHGALRVGSRYKQLFTGIGAHSPIFRVDVSDVKSHDYDVFGNHGQGSIYEQRSFGHDVVYRSLQISLPTFMDIGEDDPLLLRQYASSQRVWDALKDRHGDMPELVLRRGRAKNDEAGHSFKYWKSMALSYYFPWYHKQIRLCRQKNKDTF